MSKKTKCHLVKIKSIVSHGGAYLIEDYNGNSDFFPKSTVFENYHNNEVYIAIWILEKKSITYSRKKVYWHDSKTNKITPHINIEVIKVTPKKVEFDPNKSVDESLIK